MVEESRSPESSLFTLGVSATGDHTCTNRSYNYGTENSDTMNMLTIYEHLVSHTIRNQLLLLATFTYMFINYIINTEECSYSTITKHIIHRIAAAAAG